MSPPDLARDVAATSLEQALLAPGERVLVAVSAGADSTALAGLLDEGRLHGLPLDLVLAHVDHGWRGAAAARADAAFVRALGERLGLPTAVVPPPPHPIETEDAARRWRYHVLDALARAHGCLKLATGHHLRDQAETVLLRLERRSGRVGLRGIPVRRPVGDHGVEVIRPLLRIDPRALRAWLLARALPWREDPTNQDLSRDRARVRHRLLKIEARGGNTSTRLAALAARVGRRLARQEALLEEQLAVDLRVHPHAQAVEVPRHALAALSPGLLDLALRRIGRDLRADREGPWFTRRHLEEVQRVLEASGAVDLPRNLRFSASGRRAWLRRRTVEPFRGLELRRVDRDASDFDVASFLRAATPLEAVVDARRLGDEASVRRLRPEDAFVPWGREPERRVRVDTWLRKRQVPSFLRRVQPVVVGENGVAWVVGYRVDRGHAVHSGTRRVARLGVEDLRAAK